MIKKFVVALLFFIATVYADETGTLSLIVLKEGEPLPKQEVSILNTATNKSVAALTDEDGYLGKKLPKGKYQIRLFAKKGQKTIAFVRKNVIVEVDKESQVIISLKKDNRLSFVDTEAPTRLASTQVRKKSEVSKGSVVLSIESSETKKKVANASIFVKGSQIEAKSSQTGSATLTLPAGKHTVTIIHPDYSAQTIDVTIEPKETLSKVVALSPASMELEEFVVLAPHIEGSVAASIAQERKSDAVGNVLGSEQFSKSGDSSVASALKRVSGVTIVGGKYVYVRGLGDRYSYVMLNNLDVPSPEPTKRVVPLDIFPTSVVESITIQKSYTGDLPATFGGGTVLIKSKGIPKDDKGYAKLSLELLANDSTGSKGVYNADISKPLLGDVIAAGNDVFDPKYTESVRTYRTLDKQAKTIPPGYKVELSGGKSFEISKNLSIGASGMFYMKNTSVFNELSYDKYFYNMNDGAIYHDNHTDANNTVFVNEYAGMLNIGATYYKHNNIKYTYFTTTQQRERTQTASIDYTGDSDDREKTYYEYVEKQLDIHQISGHNDLHFGSSTKGYFDNLVIDYAYENAKATRDEPGTVEYNYLHETSGLNWDRKTWYYYFMLDDKVTNYRVDLSLPFEFNKNDNYTKFGFYSFSKKRNFDSRRYKMLSSSFDDMPQDIDTIYEQYKDDLYFSSSFRDTDSYSANQDLTAFYLKQLLSVTHDFDIVASARFEDSSQQLIDAEEAHKPLDTGDLFPSLGMTYRFDHDAMQMRLAYAKTISRPDFREFSNSRYKDPITENIVFGNPDLKATYIDHIDLKYEWYMSEDELLSLALFGKKFTNPIEKVIKLDDSQDNTFLETYQNAESATNYGIEFDLRKRFGFINKDLDKLLFATNIALIQSNIKLDTDPNNEYTSRLTSKERPMVGQSPYVVNLTLGYDNPDSGNSALFLFNQIGKRIVSLGTDHNEDNYQQPFAKLDFVWKYKIFPKEKGDLFGYALRFKAENLLDSELKFTQGDRTTGSTKPGRFYSLKFDIKY